MKYKSHYLSFVVFAGLLIFSLSFFSAAQETQLSNKNIFLDSDQDGLSDEEEKVYGTDIYNRDTDGDGYTDGAEVKAGYDPLKPAPGDKIISEPAKKEASASSENEENLTQEISTEIAGLISERTNNNQEISLDDLDVIIQKTTAESLSFDDLPEIDENEIKIKKQKYSKLSQEKREAAIKKDEQEYLVAITYILINNAPHKISNQKDINKLSNEVLSKVSLFALNMNDISYFENLADSGQKLLEEMREVEVPESVLDLHKRGLKLAHYAVSLKDTARPKIDDPVGTITKLSKVQSLLALSLEFSQEVALRFAGLEVIGLPIELDL